MQNQCKISEQESRYTKIKRDQHLVQPKSQGHIRRVAKN